MLAFPSNPTVGERHPDIEGAPSWEWDGSKWRPVGWSGSSLPSSGGTMTGPLTLESTLTLAADPTEPLEAATKGYVDDEVESVETAAKDYVDQKEAPSDNLNYGRRNGAWQEAPLIVRDATSRYLTVNAVLDPAQVWRLIEDGDALVVTVGPNTLNFHKGAAGLAGSEIAWSPPVSIADDGGLTAPGIVSGGIIQSTNGAGHALYAPNGGFYVGGTATCAQFHTFGLGFNAQSLAGWYKFHWDGANVYTIVDDWAWTHIGTHSDERMKQDIAPSTVDCLAAVEAIPVLQYRWMDNRDHLHPKRVTPTADNLVAVGLVAQRVEQVDPSLIIRPPPPAPQDSPLQINKDNMIALLVGAVQQLSERVRALEQR